LLLLAVPSPNMSVLMVERNEFFRFSSFAGSRSKTMPVAAVAVVFEIRDHVGAGVFLPLRFVAVEHVERVLIESVEVAVAGDGAVQGVLDRLDDEIAALICP
jgi:hypothetical protein